MMIVNDPVDELLKADAAQHRDRQIDDGGFTLRVIDQLPGGSSMLPAIRIAIPLAFTLLAVACVAYFSGAGNLLIDAAMDIATNSLSRSAIAFLAVVGVLGAASISAASEN